ncbi:hypothetical protein [Hymenobacter cellulosilyticus]|uniref:Uncharacterized protein n=1 Tax=Hymenobacter cellulosilyticus TaxID=2932248 RepID=A0A8T9Q0Z6_9BACT|nr:hypothetical protein [Hymenobacter cellulosilyticus]UOQ71436.1 hypothetical protein MUN79_22885 [Hymenobacter cellulosilyticus]
MLEVLLAFLHRFFQGRVVGLAPDGALHVVGRVAGVVEVAAKQAAGGPHQLPGNADAVGVKARHVAIAAFVAVKLKLEAFVSGQVVVVGDELNQVAHGGRACGWLPKSSRYPKIRICWLHNGSTMNLHCGPKRVV